MTNIEQLYSALQEYTKADVALAFSGGVDSALLLALLCRFAAENHTKVYAITASTKLHPAKDLEISKALAKEYGAIHLVVEIDELEEAGIQNNPKDRCYLCKLAIFQKICALARTYQVNTILEGTNLDDLGVYRPGIRALRELQIISPLADCSISKETIRSLAAKLGLTVSNRPSSPCLATRLPYDTPIDYALLSRIDKGEQLLRHMGFYNVRLRIHGSVTRIEVDQTDFQQILTKQTEILSELKKLGFHYITLDLEGFRSGSMDE